MHGSQLVSPPVREILPELVTQIMLLLSSGEGEQEEVYLFHFRVLDKSN